MLASILFLALAVPSQIAPNDNPPQGAYLFHACKAATRQMDHPDDPSANTVEAVVCISYFEGFIDGKSATGHGPCLGSASYEAVVRVYVAYMEKHPEVMNKDNRVGVILALGGAYPCPMTPISNERLKSIRYPDSPIDASYGLIVVDGMWIPETSNPAKALLFAEQVDLTCDKEEKTCRELTASLGKNGDAVQIMNPEEKVWAISSWDTQGLLASYGPDDSAHAASEKCHRHVLTITFSSGAVSTSDIPTHTIGCEAFEETDSYRLTQGNYYVDTSPANDADRPHATK